MATNYNMRNQIGVSLEEKTEHTQSHENIQNNRQPEVGNGEVLSAPDGRDKLIERLERENSELLETHKLHRHWEHKYFKLDVVSHELQTKNDQLEDELMECKEEILKYRKLDIANKELQGLIQARELRVTSLTHDNMNLQAQLEQFRKNDTSQELANMKRELELDNHKLKLSTIEMRCVIDAQVARLQILEKEKVSLEEEFLLSQEKIKDFNQLENIHNEMKSLFNAREGQFVNLQKENKHLHMKVDYYLQQLRCSAEKLIELNKLKQIQGENIELKKALDAQKVRAENLKNDKYNLIAELEQTHKKLEDSMKNFVIEQKRHAAISYRMGKIEDVLEKAKKIENQEKDREAKLNDAEIENERLRQEIGRLNALVLRLERLGSSEGKDHLATSSICPMPDKEEDSNKWSWHGLLKEMVS